MGATMFLVSASDTSWCFNASTILRSRLFVDTVKLDSLLRHCFHDVYPFS